MGAQRTPAHDDLAKDVMKRSAVDREWGQERLLFHTERGARPITVALSTDSVADLVERVGWAGGSSNVFVRTPDGIVSFQLLGVKPADTE